MLDDLVALSKRRGFIFQGSEVYGGLAGTWDYGPLGAQLKHNLKNLWWRTFVEDRPDIYGLDSAILMNSSVWQASGHTGAGFSDILVEDLVNKKRYRADQLLAEAGVSNPPLEPEALDKEIAKLGLKSPDGNPLSKSRHFNTMFQTQIGALGDEQSKVYLRPETAQGMFVNFKNVVDSLQPDLPFGIAQMGKAFRNEISPRDFIFRTREFEQMEIEYFCSEADWPEVFEAFKGQFYDWFDLIGLDKSRVTELDVPESDRAHYSSKTIDFEFKFSFGTKELSGLAYRGNYDLSNHQKASGKSFEYIDKRSQAKIIPHCVEPTFGLDRIILALLESAYKVDEANKRTYLAFNEQVAPVRYCVSPLLKNQSELVEKARQVYRLLQTKYGRVTWDDHSNIGKRYRRQDEIGTPYCVVVDFETLENGTVTRRERDSLAQERLAPDSL